MKEFNLIFRRNLINASKESTIFYLAKQKRKKFVSNIHYIALFLASNVIERVWHKYEGELEYVIEYSRIFTIK